MGFSFKHKKENIMSINKLQKTKRTMSAPLSIVKDTHNHLNYALSCAYHFTDPLSVSIDTGTVRIYQRIDADGWHELKQSTMPNGYQVVHPRTIKTDGTINHHICYVHRLVAASYVENSNGNKYVDHIDGDKQNNAPSNLRWVTARENQLYRRLSEIKKLKPHNRGCSSGMLKQGRYLKLSADGQETLYFKRLTDAAKALGCTSQNISMCLRRNYRVCGWNAELINL